MRENYSPNGDAWTYLRMLFHQYFHGDTGAGPVAKLIQQIDGTPEQSSMGSEEGAERYP